MHLHDVLRLWRSEIVRPATQVAWTEDAARVLSADQRAALAREVVPGELRRDDRSGLSVLVAPARHEPNPPATDDALDALEDRLGFELPRPLELLFRLHDGGDFFVPTDEGLPEPLGAPLHLLSAAEVGEAYGELLTGMRAALEEEDYDDEGLFRLARRFGASTDRAPGLAKQLGAVFGGVGQGLAVVPLVRVPNSQNLMCLVPASGRDGRVGCGFAASGFLPDHSDEYAFDGLEGWLQAILKAKACRRIVLS